MARVNDKKEASKKAKTKKKEETAETMDAAAEKEEKVGVSEEDRLKTELDEAKDKYLRLYSEFENFRRRTAKEKLEQIATATANLMVELLPVVDDFERAQVANEKQKDIEAIKEGFNLIHDKLFKTLVQKGLKVMETDKGTPFDAELHEAITQIPVEEEDLKGKIVDTIEKGYYLSDKVVRFAKVVTGA